MNFLVINGPNLNCLGRREVQHYGSSPWTSIAARLDLLASDHGHHLDHFQSNAEHELIERIHQAHSDYQAMIVNPGALAHTSIALRDALLLSNCRFYEVHISNIYARESFRAHSYLSDIASGIITGCGDYGYDLALLAAINSSQEN